MNLSTTDEIGRGLVGELSRTVAKSGPSGRNIYVPGNTTRGVGTLAVHSAQNKGAAVKMHSAVFGEAYSPRSNRRFTCSCKGSMSLATPASQQRRQRRWI